MRKHFPYHHHLVRMEFQIQIQYEQKQKLLHVFLHTVIVTARKTGGILAVLDGPEGGASTPLQLSLNTDCGYSLRCNENCMLSSKQRE